MSELTSSRAAAVAGSREHLNYIEHMAKPVPPSKLERAEGEIDRFLAETGVLYLSTACTGGWSATSCMSFGSLRWTDGTPRLYLAAGTDAFAVERLAADPRVSCSLYVALGFELRRQAFSLNLQAVGDLLEDNEECAAARKLLDAKHGAGGYAGAIIRIVPLLALWYDAPTRLRGTIDYGAMREKK